MTNEHLLAARLECLRLAVQTCTATHKDDEIMYTASSFFEWLTESLPDILAPTPPAPVNNDDAGI